MCAIPVARRSTGFALLALSIHRAWAARIPAGPAWGCTSTLDAERDDATADPFFAQLDLLDVDFVSDPFLSSVFATDANTHFEDKGDLLRLLMEDLFSLRWDSLLAISSKYFPDIGRQRGSPESVVKRLNGYLRFALDPAGFDTARSLGRPARLHELCRQLAGRLSSLPLIGVLRRMTGPELSDLLAGLGQATLRLSKPQALARLLSRAEDKGFERKLRAAVDAQGSVASDSEDEPVEECPAVVQDELASRFGARFAAGEERRIYAALGRRLTAELKGLGFGAFVKLMLEFGLMGTRVSVIQHLVGSLPDALPLAVAERLLGSSSPGALEESCPWLAAFWIPPITAPLVPRECPIDVQALAEPPLQGVSDGFVTQRLGDALAKLDSAALVAMSKLYIPEIARHRGPATAIIGRLLRLLPAAASPEQMLAAMSQRLRGQALVSESCRWFAGRLRRMPWAGVLRESRAADLLRMLGLLGVRAPQTRHRPELVAKILTATSLDAALLRRLLAMPEMSPEALRAAAMAAWTIEQCPIEVSSSRAVGRAA